MIIYEVDITVDQFIYSKYKDWLDKHIVKMLRYEGHFNFKKYESTFFKRKTHNSSLLN